jgi:hypothetical protein
MRRVQTAVCAELRNISTEKLTSSCVAYSIEIECACSVADYSGPLWLRETFHELHVI